ncbi:MAG: hypothetical protein EGR51_00845, partial [Oscillibacter sp.]|nr:hypothetical protein [Oscillibacter sp.]
SKRLFHLKDIVPKLLIRCVIGGRVYRSRPLAHIPDPVYVVFSLLCNSALLRPVQAGFSVQRITHGILPGTVCDLLIIFFLHQIACLSVHHMIDQHQAYQRRNQKLIEEAPARCLTPELRERMGAAAVKAAKAVGYENAGTVEFLLDPDREHFYFMEMNTRIQVEHGVTELVTGVDLVRQQLRIASGLALRLRQEDVTLQGHAIECRINAEDPVQGFRPCPGRVDFLHFPGGPGVRVDSCLYSGCELSPYYDSMAAKILAYAPTRMETIRRMRRCLEEFTLEGFPTNAELSYQILYHPEFILGECTTAFLDEHLSELLEFSRKLSESGVDA